MKMLLSVMLAVLMSITPVLVTLAPADAKQPKGTGVTLPVSGTFRNPIDQSTGTVAGSFTIQQFIQTGDPVHPVGALGTLALQTSTGQTVMTRITMPVSFGGSTNANAISTQQVTCEVLELTLGPLDLNLLGLEIHLDEVHLVIEANPAGGLLGQLLCAIANLLNGGNLSNLVALVQLLNQLLTLLSGLGQ